VQRKKPFVVSLCSRQHRCFHRRSCVIAQVSIPFAQFQTHLFRCSLQSLGCCRDVPAKFHIGSVIDVLGSLDGVIEIHDAQSNDFVSGQHVLGIRFQALLQIVDSPRSISGLSKVLYLLFNFTFPFGPNRSRHSQCLPVERLSFGELMSLRFGAGEHHQALNQKFPTFAPPLSAANIILLLTNLQDVFLARINLFRYVFRQKFHCFKCRFVTVRRLAAEVTCLLT